MTKLVRGLAPLLLLFLLSGCGDFFGGGGRRIVPTGTTWTVMVFLNAANDLDDPLFRCDESDIEEMLQGTASPDVQVVVQWKRIALYNPPWEGTRRYLIKNTQLQLIEELPADTDMGDADTLKAFVQWAKQNYPADHYVLVIWNHGSGWRARERAPITRGVSFDDETGNSIDTWNLPPALAADPPLDILAFDASLMQMLEVAYECRNVARYIVGSEESPPCEGYPYHLILGALSANPRMTPAEFSQIIVQKTIQHYSTDSDITHSAIDPSKLEAVATALDDLAQSLIDRRIQYRDQLESAREDAQNYKDPEFKDLWHVAQLIKEYINDADLSRKATALQTAIGAALIAEAHGTRGVENSHGLSIFYPDFSGYVPRYESLALARVTQWDEWLKVAP